ncbi:uncharacterized protein LOC123003747 [Tribolium madens]|uniref:uncharacterized protein LOC123003747 n=1 Tax=Tribolium madens TaxID=41895 RepID=UPI001CF75673|nr:uncharacterized protein LOC123003747 [Tribolium madens]
MKPLKTFLGCASLRTGTLVAGVAGIVLAIIGIIVIYTVQVEFKTIVLDWLPQDVVRIIIVINFAMAILISILLIAGTLKRNAFLMMPWVILAIMLAIGLLVSVIYTAVQFYINGKSIEGTIWIVLGIISVIIYVYMWLVVFSYFTFIREETKRGAYIKDPFRRHY